MVDENGQLVLPRLEPIDAAGMLVSELTQRITKLLETYVVDPVVTVTFAAPVPRMVAALGAVQRPGSYELGAAPTVLTLLAAAGGPTPDGNLAEAVLIRGNAYTLVVSADSTIPMPANVALQPNDALFIPTRRAPGVFVVGAVNRPGLLPLPEAPDAALAVILAGGATAEADLRSAFIIREGVRLPVDLGAVIAPDPGEPAPQSGTALQAGDVIVVPTLRQRSVFVVGGAKTPGPQLYPEADRASKAVAMAGGKAPNADLAGAFVLRAGQKLPVDLKQVLEQGNADADALLEPGDAVVVPEIPRTIHVAGATAKPGVYELDQASTVLNALSLCGGLAPDADAWHAQLVRGNQSQPLDLHALMEGGDLSFNAILEPGDTIVVPQLQDLVYVMGAVGRPGPQPIRPGDSLMDILGRAGGLTPTALKAVFVYRKDTLREADARVQLINLATRRTTEQLREAAKSAAAGESVEVIEGPAAYEARPGDVMFVPSRLAGGGGIMQNMLQELIRTFIYRGTFF